MNIPIPAYIKTLAPYVPGKPIEELERQYGVKNAIKLASNENAWGPSPKAIAAVSGALARLHLYPDGASFELSQALARHLDCSPDMVILGNGSNELIEFLVKACIQPGDEAISSFPSFLMYQKFVQIHGGINKVVPLKDMGHDFNAVIQALSARTRLIFLDNPNNPTGSYFDRQAFLRLCEALPESVIIVLDEAYVDFVSPARRFESIKLIKARRRQGPQIAALRTFSKAYGLAGLRLGYGVMAPELAAVLHRVRQPFNVNSLAQCAAVAALSDTEHYERTVQGTRAGMVYLQEEAKKLGCRAYPSETNFFLIDVGVDAGKLFEAMLYKGVIIRSMHAYGYPGFIRVTVGTEIENHRFIAALGECLHELHHV